MMKDYGRKGRKGMNHDTHKDSILSSYFVLYNHDGLAALLERVE